jgi:hypothetical protein
MGLVLFLAFPFILMFARLIGRLIGTVFAWIVNGSESLIYRFFSLKWTTQLLAVVGIGGGGWMLMAMPDQAGDLSAAVPGGGNLFATPVLGPITAGGLIGFGMGMITAHLLRKGIQRGLESQRPTSEAAM